jgi:hypothetical protein
METFFGRIFKWKALSEPVLWSRIRFDVKRTKSKQTDWIIGKYTQHENDTRIRRIQQDDSWSDLGWIIRRVKVEANRRKISRIIFLGLLYKLEQTLKLWTCYQWPRSALIIVKRPLKRIIKRLVPATWARIRLTIKMNRKDAW